jgi:DNA-binding PadR family transcriptional regulator
VGQHDGAAPLTPAVFHILLALADGPLHGYGIMRRVHESSGIEMGPGTIYGSIGRLSDAGWIEEGEDDSTDRRRGKSFLLTGAGRSALESEARRITGLARLEGVRRLATAAEGPSV